MPHQYHKIAKECYLFLKDSFIPLCIVKTRDHYRHTEDNATEDSESDHIKS